MMNTEQIRTFCLALPRSTEDIPFDFSTYGGIVGFRVGGKIFAMFDTNRPEWFVLKCDPELAEDLRARHEEITPAWHMNKRYWNQVNIFATLPDRLVEQMILHSYILVVQGLPRRVRTEHPEIEISPELDLLSSSN